MDLSSFEFETVHSHFEGMLISKYKNGSKTENVGLHLCIKYHEAMMLQKMFTTP
jgi:hypothetical protein